MSEDEETLTIEQLTELTRLFLETKDKEHEEVDKVLRQWVETPSSIPTAFEIIQSSEIENLRFIAACCLHYFIKLKADIFSEENLLDMANLFADFIMKNKNRLDAQDTTDILVSLADICVIFPLFIEQVLKMFPPDIFLALIGMVTEEVDDINLKIKFKTSNQVDNIIEQLKDTVYQYFTETPFTKNWAKSFCQFFRTYKKAAYCIPFLERIEMMAQDQNFFNNFISIVTETFSIRDDGEDTQLYEFNTAIVQIAVPFALNNSNHAALIWKSIFGFSAFFFFSEDRIEFTNFVVESFFQSIPSFYDDDIFVPTIESFVELTYNTADQLIKYPDELWLKYILTFIGVIIDLYNEDQDKKIEGSFNQYCNCKFVTEIQEFIISQPISPGTCLLYSSNIFSKGKATRTQIFDQIFQLPEIPYQAFKFIKKYFNEIQNESYVQRFIQAILDSLDSHTNESTLTLRFLSNTSDLLKPLTYDLSTALLPILQNFSLKDQSNLIIMFLNILSENDSDKIETIKNQVLQVCSLAIESSELDKVKKAMNFVQRIFDNFKLRKEKESPSIINNFMRELLPLSFHEFAPIATHEDVNIQESLCNIIVAAAQSKCIVFPESKDEDERRNLLIESDPYGEILQWLFSIINQYLCSGHFKVISCFKIKPFPEVLNAISQIEPKENSTTVSEMIDYILSSYEVQTEVSLTITHPAEQIFSVIPVEFFYNLFNSDSRDTVCKILVFFREIKVDSIELRKSIMKEIITKYIDWISEDIVLTDTIKTLAVLISGSEENFSLYLELMTSAFDQLEVNGPYFTNLWKICQKSKYQIEDINKKAPLSETVNDLKCIISSNIGK